MGVSASFNTSYPAQRESGGDNVMVWLKIQEI